MLFNLATDVIIGVIPVLGDIFDFRFCSHRRNIELMHEHYVEGRHGGSAWLSVIIFILLILLMIFGFVYMTNGVGQHLKKKIKLFTGRFQEIEIKRFTDFKELYLGIF